MYVHRSKNRRNKRGNESVHFFGPRKGDGDNRLDEEVIFSPSKIKTHVSSFVFYKTKALRCAAEKTHISYFSKRIEFLMRRYLDTESGKEEVNTLIQVVDDAESRKYLSLRDPNDVSKVTQEIDAIHNQRKMVKKNRFSSCKKCTPFILR